jgi:BNR/Asp-box repeat
MSSFGRWGRCAALGALLAVSPCLGAPIPPGGWTTNGPPLFQVNAVAADPARDSSVYSASSIYDAKQSAIFHSADGGKTWEPLVELRTGEFYSTVLVDPREPQRIYAGSNEGNVYRSIDGGAHWSKTGSVSPSCSPSFAAGSGAQTVLAACGSTLLRSPDGGGTWTALPAPFTQATKLTPGTPGTVLAYGPSGVFRSANDGDSWTPIATAPAACSTILAVRMDPSNANVLVAGTGSLGAGGSVCGGVFRSTDGGRTWGAIAISGFYVTDLVLDPRNPATVYAGASSLPGILPRGGVFESRDGGASFIDLRLPASGALRLALSPSGRLLHAATSIGAFVRGFRRTSLLEPRE